MISVVIVTYNSEACIATCLDAVARSLPQAERIVVDNASSDRGRETAERLGATVIALESNLGFGRACNIGAEHATHKHVLFLNPDVVIASADVKRLGMLLEAERFGLVVPTSASDKFMFAEDSWVKETLSLAVRALRPRELPAHSPAHRRGRAVWASGAVLLTRRAEFLDVGGFDSSYFLYYEDRDLSWRYRKRGLPIRAIPILHAEHAGGGSSEVSDRRSDIAAFAVIGWIQYRYSTNGYDAAVRTWRLFSRAHTLVTRLVGWAARVAPTSRLRRKCLQLREITRELDLICRSSGTLVQSDAHDYWPGAVVVLSTSQTAP